MGTYEKGRVERAIRYIRAAFLPARQYRDLDDLNAQALAWCHSEAQRRPWPEDTRLRVSQVFDDEQASLMALPEHDYALGERVAVKVGKTPYARYDLNDYSLPHTHVQRTLSVLATPQRVRIFDGVRELASHSRCWDSGQQIEDPEHVQSLQLCKRKARAHRGVDRLAHAAPGATQLMALAAQRGENLGSITATLLRLLDRYGATPLQAAIECALEQGVPHPNAVRLALERAREEQGLPPPTSLCLSDEVARRDAPVRTHSLASYDRLAPAPSDLEDPEQ